MQKCISFAITKQVYVNDNHSKTVEKHRIHFSVPVNHSSSRVNVCHIISLLFLFQSGSAVTLPPNRHISIVVSNHNTRRPYCGDQTPKIERCCARRTSFSRRSSRPWRPLRPPTRTRWCCSTTWPSRRRTRSSSGACKVKYICIFSH